MPNTYFSVFSTLLNTAKSLKECVHNPISFLDIRGMIQYGSFTYCEEFFYITDGVTNSLPPEVKAILTDQRCAEKINSTVSGVYDFACKIAGYTCHSNEVAGLIPELNTTYFIEQPCNYSIPSYITDCFSFVIQTACEKVDELQAALDESTKRKFALIMGSVFAIGGLSYGLYSIYKRHKNRSQEEKSSVLQVQSSSDSDLETPGSILDFESPRLNSTG